MKNLNKLNLVERHVFLPSHPDYKTLDNLCFLSKNLYNATLYCVRQHFFKTGSFLNYQTVNKQFTLENQPDYRALPAKVSKHTQQLVDKSYKSFFTLHKNGKKARIPRYLDKIKGRQVVHYEQGAISVKEKGFVKLSQTPIKIKSKVQQPKFARIVPCGNHIVVEIGYQQETTLKPLNGRAAAIDLGLNNLATLVSNIKDLKPLLFNGKPIKSINQFANKKIAKEQSLLDTGKKTNRSKINKLFLKRKHKITNYMHKVSREIVNYLVSNQITSLVIGKNKGWKQDVNLGKRNNQNFVYVPFNQFVEMLKYKCSLQGIEVSIVSENYTSKCSFFDDEAIGKHLNYAGKRIKRGLFRTANGKLVNADVNGAYNILKKYLLETGKGALNSVEVCSMPEKFTLKS